jgi:hypothetical protein
VIRRYLALPILLALSLPILVAFTPENLSQDSGQHSPVPQQPAGIQIIVHAGFNGIYRRGEWTPVRVTVSNSGATNLAGEIRARIGDGSSLDEVTYSTPIDLPSGSRKQVFLYASLENFAQSLQVEVIDQDGRIAGRGTGNLRMAGRGDVVMAVVTDSFVGAVDLTGRIPGIGTAYQTNWRIEDIPPLAEALAGLDVLMFHDVNTGSLRSEQLTAISNWVLSGGHLIVAGGESWQRTTTGLQDLLPVSLQGTVPVDTMAPLAEYLRLPTGEVDEGMTATASTLEPDAQVMVSIGNVPLIVRHRYGSGVVDFIAVDPNSEPLRTWPGKEDLWYTLLASDGQEPSWADGFKVWSIARDATLTTFSMILPTFLQLCGFLVVYILLIGPVNYLILRQFNRRELAWFTMPVLILVFSVLAYSVGFNLRGNRATISRLTVVRTWENAEQAEVISLVGIQSPRRSTYDIEIERGHTLRVLPEEGIGLNVPATIREGTRYVADSIRIDAGTIASFTTTGYLPAPKLDAAVTWHLVDGHAPYVEGTITNTTGMALLDTVVLIKGGSQVIGTLEPGETQTFEMSLGPQDPGPLSRGNALTWYRYGSYSSSWNNPYGSPGWCFGYEGISLTIPDVMHGERFSCSSSNVGDRAQEIRRRYRLLAALVVDYDLSGGRDSGAYLFAWTDEALVNIELAGRPYNEEDTTLFIFDLPVTVASAPLVEIPAGLTTWSVTETDDPKTLREIAPVQFQVGRDAQAAFQFMPMPEMRLEQVDELLVKFQGQGPLFVELWNWVSESWTPVVLDPESDTTPIADPGRFLGPENAVNVRIISDGSNSYNQVRYIKVAYRGVLAG